MVSIDLLYSLLICRIDDSQQKLQTGVVEMLDEKTFFATISQIAMSGL
jgi:hypothetical protein